MREWRSATVSELEAEGVLLVQDGNHGNDRPLTHEFVTVGTPFIRAADMADGRVLFDRASQIDATALTRIRKGHGQAGDSVLSHKGTVGKVAFVPADTAPFVCSPQTTFWRSLDPGIIDARFLNYVLRSPAFVAQLDSQKGETDMAPYVSLTQQRQLRISFPSLSEQQAIAEVLGALDDKIAANAALAQSAELLAQTIYDNAEGSAQRQPMSQVLTPVLGGTPSRSIDDYWGGSELWVSARDITAASSSVIVETEEHITASAVAQTKAKPLTVGSVILTARGTVGKVARLAKQASFNQSCYGFIPGALPSSILYFAIRSATERAKAMAHGSVFDTITMGTFDHLEIADFDREASAPLEAVLRPLLDTVTAAVEENRTLAATRDTRLPQLMSGRLRVRDAERLAEEAGA